MSIFVFVLNILIGGKMRVVVGNYLSFNWLMISIYMFKYDVCVVLCLVVNEFGNSNKV